MNPNILILKSLYGFELDNFIDSCFIGVMNDEENVIMSIERHFSIKIKQNKQLYQELIEYLSKYRIKHSNKRQIKNKLVYLHGFFCGFEFKSISNINNRYLKTIQSFPTIKHKNGINLCVSHANQIHISHSNICKDYLRNLSKTEAKYWVVCHYLLNIIVEILINHEIWFMIVVESYVDKLKMLIMKNTLNLLTFIKKHKKSIIQRISTILPDRLVYFIDIKILSPTIKQLFTNSNYTSIQLSIMNKSFLSRIIKIKQIIKKINMFFNKNPIQNPIELLKYYSLIGYYLIDKCRIKRLIFKKNINEWQEFYDLVYSLISEKYSSFLFNHMSFKIKSKSKSGSSHPQLHLLQYFVDNLNSGSKESTSYLIKDVCTFDEIIEKSNICLTYVPLDSFTKSYISKKSFLKGIKINQLVDLGLLFFYLAIGVVPLSISFHSPLNNLQIDSSLIKYSEDMSVSFKILLNNLIINKINHKSDLKYEYMSKINQIRVMIVDNSDFYEKNNKNKSIKVSFIYKNQLYNSQFNDCCIIPGSTCYVSTASIIHNQFNNMARKLLGFLLETEHRIDPRVMQLLQNQLYVYFVNKNTLFKSLFPSHFKDYSLNEIKCLESGRLGELATFKYLQKLDSVFVWVNQLEESMLPYDFILINQQKQRIYIEVKTTSNMNVNYFNLSMREIQQAIENLSNFHVYFVKINNKDLSDVEFQIFDNLVDQIKSKKISLIGRINN